jgi:type 1 glutamine amidotransferase
MTYMKSKTLQILSFVTFLVAAFSADAKPLKAILITGGCCHDYAKQQHIISEGINERVPTIWKLFYEMNQEKSKEALSKKGWADEYDYVVWNHCFAHETDTQFIDSLAAIHKAGKPAIALHCAMHSYHWKVPQPKDGEKTWPAFLGVSSRGHGPKKAIKVTKAKGKADHPVLKGIPDEWTTEEGELYNVQRVLTAEVLAYGDNGKVKEPQALIWVNEFGKGRVFGTTLGHHNSTMSSKAYLDLLGNAVKWINKID